MVGAQGLRTLRAHQAQLLLAAGNPDTEAASHSKLASLSIRCT
jgi:hypothetical protein